jgi:hypothetical protein
MAYFGVYYMGDGNKGQLCEVESGVCYEAHKTAAQAAESIAAQCQKPDNYFVAPIAPGIAVYDRDSDSIVIVK